MNNTLFNLTDRVALITGGNSGLGRSMALGLRDAGATVVVTGRDPEKNAAMAAELGDPQAVLPLDVRDESAVEQTIAAVTDRLGRLDILINNAGAYRGGTAVEVDLSDWQAIIDTNLTGAFICARHAARVMIAQESGGKIVNIGSMYSVFGGSGGANYAASKTGLLGLTRALAVELGRHNIQVNAILPGWHWTPMTASIKGSPSEERIRRTTPAGRWGTADDVVGAAVFLASSASDFVTGAEIAVDGGYSISKEYAADG